MQQSRKYKFDDLVDYILKQDNNKKLDMSDSVGIGCGCVLVQFGRKHLKKKISSCGFSNVRFLDEGTIRNLDVENVTGYEPKFVADIVQKGLMRSVKNYGDLKKIVFEVIQ